MRLLNINGNATFTVFYYFGFKLFLKLCFEIPNYCYWTENCVEKLAVRSFGQQKVQLIRFLVFKFEVLNVFFVVYMRQVLEERYSQFCKHCTISKVSELQNVIFCKELRSMCIKRYSLNPHFYNYSMLWCPLSEFRLYMWVKEVFLQLECVPELGHVFWPVRLAIN